MSNRGDQPEIGPGRLWAWISSSAWVLLVSLDDTTPSHIVDSLHHRQLQRSGVTNNGVRVRLIKLFVGGGSALALRAGATWDEQAE